MANYESLANTAKRLIEKNGRDATLTKLSEIPVDPNKPWRTLAPGTMNENQESVDCKAVFTGLETAQGRDGVVRSYQIALVAAKSALLSGNEVDLSKYDTLTDGSTKWTIGRIDPLKPGDRMILWKFYLSQ